MRIALIDPSLFTWPYDHALAQGLEHNGHEVRVYGKHLADGEQGKNARDYREVFYPGFHASALARLPHALFLALKGLMHPFSLLALNRELKAFRPDIIHFQWAPLPAIDRLFIPLFRRIAPVILTVHDSTPFNDNPGSKLQRLGAIDIMRRFDRLIVHTEQARKRLLKHGIPERMIARIDHGILGIEALPSSIRVADTLPESGQVTLLLFGKLKPYKGADILIRALAALPAAERARCRLRIVGKAYMDVEPLHALARELGVEDRIHWDLRFVDEAEMAELFAAADIMVMPYREIDASGVLMVALAIGKPIIASRIGLFAEMLEEGKHALLVKSEDVQALADAIAMLAQDGDRRKRMGEQVRALKDAIPDWNTIARMTERLYQQAIQLSPR